MLYMALIAYDPTVPRGDDEPASLPAEHLAVEREMRDAGVYVSGAGLMPPEYAPIVRLRAGVRMATDGPFAESKELIGGYYMLDCKDEADAIAWASKIPAERRAWIEVRQIALFHPNAERIAALATP